MSAVRVGTDLQRVDEVAETLARFGVRYTERFFTARELAGCGPAGRPSAQSLAARFAAKEAVLKVLRTGDRAPDLRSIEIVRQPGGAPQLVLHGEAAELADAAGLHDWDVSLSHVPELATATVVALADPPERPIGTTNPATRGSLEEA